MATLALIVVASVGFFSARTYAQVGAPSAERVQATVTPAQPEATEPADVLGSEVEEGTEGPDMEAVGAESGEQTGDDQQDPSYAGSIAVPETTGESQNESDAATALAGLATITADEADAVAQAANPGTTVVKTELDDENGYLVYSMALDSGVEVKVDAGNGAVLHTETGTED